jgi:hypothetical protein
MPNKQSDPDQSLDQILHEFGTTYRVLTKEERQEDIARAKAAIKAWALRQALAVKPSRIFLANLQGSELASHYRRAISDYEAALKERFGE